MSEPLSTTARRPRCRPVPVSIEPMRPSPILTLTICAPGATPLSSGLPAKCAATMPATCVPCGEQSVTMETTQPSS